MKKTYISKSETKILYGIAVLLMVFHHLFYAPERLGDSYVSMLNWNGIEYEQILGNFAKICVPIYAFISGYGMFLSCYSKHGEVWYKNVWINYKAVARHLVGFYKKYWLVFIIFVPMGFIWFGYNFKWEEFLQCFIGRAAVYNGEWWYVWQYVCMLALFPILDCIIDLVDKYILQNKHRSFFFLGVMLVILGGIYIIPACKAFKVTMNLFLQRQYLYVVFVEGYLLARYNLYDCVSEMLKKKWVRCACAVALIIFVLLGRIRLVHDAANTITDIVFTPVFIFAVVTLCHEMNKNGIFGKMFSFMGEQSTYIWLTHTFFAYYYFPKMVMLPRYSLLIYIWLVLISILMALGLSVMNRKIEMIMKKEYDCGYENK